MRIVCQQTILMKYHTLFVIFEKSSEIWNCRLLQIIGVIETINLKKKLCYHLCHHDITFMPKIIKGR